MTTNAPPDFKKLLKTLVDHGVEFVVVGGVCAVLHGAPIATFDLDIVHSREPANLDRLLETLAELDAFYRNQPQRRLRPDRSHLASTGHQLLMTNLGPLDILGSIGSGREFPELATRSVRTEAGGVSFRILGLESLIRVKEETAHSKDKATLEILRQTLREIKRKQ